MPNDDVPPPVPGQLPYENTADAVVADQAFQLYRSRGLQVAAFSTDGVVSAQVWGRCPRCDHDINVQQTITVPLVDQRGRGLWDALRRTRRDPGIPESVDVGCRCDEPHPGAPELVRGCGASFRLPTRPLAGPDASPTSQGSP